MTNCRRYQRHRRQICHRYQRHRRQNFAISSPCVVDTGGKFAPGVNDTGGKFAAGVNDARGKLPPVSTTPAANLPPVSLTPVAINENNIRLQIPESELEGKNLYICFLYYPKVTK
jgi:hypothetical protein